MPLGCGWGGAKETAPPAVVLSPSSRRQASPAGSGNQKRTLVGRSRRVGSSPTDGRWGTDDGGDQTLEESRPNTQKQAERGHIGRKERGDWQDVPEGARNPDESRRGGKGRYHIITDGTT